MFVRVLQVIAVTLYIVGAIAAVAYLGGSFYWLVPLLAPAIYCIFTFEDLRPPARAHLSVPPQPRSTVFRARIDVRIEELKNGPPHRNQDKYIDAVSRGIPYSDERIDYLEFPDLLVLCDHLRPLEAAMRAARLPMENHRPGFVEVSCVMQVPRIRKQVPLDGCVEFTLEPGPDNHAPDIHVARCTRCGHSIEESLYGGPWPVG
jgi:hypothetical protein